MLHNNKNGAARCLLAILFVSASCLAYQAAFDSPNLDEMAHLPSGVAIVRDGRFDLYRVNPPLIKSIAALPAVFGHADFHRSPDFQSEFGRPETIIAQNFLAANQDGWFRWYYYARLSLLPLSLLGGLPCYVWAKELYGRSAGLLSLAVWCFSPNILAWGASITPDMGAASLGLLASWRFWKWLRTSTWSNAFFAGLTLGLVELTKMTWIILFLLWPAMWLLWRWLDRDFTSDASPLKYPHSWAQARQLTFILLLGLYFLNVGYAFDGSFCKLGNYNFGSRVLAGEDNIIDGGEGGNRFRGTFLEHIPVPLPREYLRGMDLQKIDFEKKLTSYLNGEWKEGGWWSYYIEAIVLKVPLGYWVIALIVAIMTFTDSRYRARWKDEVILLIPAVAVFTLVSSQTGFSRHLRYILPCFPFVFIWCGKVTQSWQCNHKLVSAIAALGLAWGIGSSLCVFPHSMSYFNELAGGPNGGHRYLLDANIDWGQDLFYFKDWYDEHPEARPIVTDFRTFVDEKYYHIESIPYSKEPAQWYAISIHRLFEEHSRYEWLWKHHVPVAKAGYSIWIFHVPKEHHASTNTSADYE